MQPLAPKTAYVGRAARALALYKYDVLCRLLAPKARAAGPTADVFPLGSGAAGEK